MFNSKLTAHDLTKDSKELIAYDGNSLNENSDAKRANAYYDSNNNTAAINTAQTDNISTNQVASSIAHEAIGHKIGGESEFVAGFVAETVQNNWNSYQEGNTSFQLTLPTATAGNNAYAGGVVFGGGSGVSPLRDVNLVQGMTKNQESFGPRWIDPNTGKVSKVPLEGYQLRKTPHQGNDLSAPKGSIINSAFDGKVVLSRSVTGYGNTLVIERDDTLGKKVYGLYGHMAELSQLKVGDLVIEGQLVGLVGNTGTNSQGNHLHFGIKEPDAKGSFSFDSKNPVSGVWINPSSSNFGKYENLQDTPAYQQGRSQLIIQKNKP